jgi:hypothetical protein
MQQISTTSSPARIPVNWSFLEVWVDTTLPYVLLLLGDESGHWYIHDPAEQYKVIFASSNYEEAKLWLLEDEYDLVNGRLSYTEEF